MSDETSSAEKFTGRPIDTSCLCAEDHFGNIHKGDCLAVDEHRRHYKVPVGEPFSGICTSDPGPRIGSDGKTIQMFSYCFISGSDQRQSVALASVQEQAASTAEICRQLAGIRELMAKQLAAYLSKEVPEENKKDGFVVEVLNTPITLSRKPEFQYE